MEFLTTKKISGAIEGVLTEAKSFITLISPYIEISGTYVERLQDAARNNVTVCFVYGKQELNREQAKNLSSVKGLDLRYLDNLHAKCYLNEHTAVMGSMNLYNFSESNREMGILVTKKSNPDIFEKIQREADSILHAAVQESTFSKTVKAVKKVIREITHAHCIRCGDPIAENPDKPLCQKCFKLWSKFENPDYAENCCHICGADSQTSVRRPLCRECWENFA